MNETKKLNEYRIQNNYDNYFKGNGIDIGGGCPRNNDNEFNCINGFDSTQIISTIENLK